eukprot:12218019-Karenia_brevis.AAC.1
MREITSATKHFLIQLGPEEAKLFRILASHSEVDWTALGRYVSQLRQARRHLRKSMEAVTNKVFNGNYAVRKAAWKMRGGSACDHG